MFFAVALLLCAIEVLTPHINAIDSDTNMQVGIALLALLACAQRGRKKERAVLTVFAIWYVWIAASDWLISYMPPILASYEAYLFGILVAWAWLRPYRYVSDQWTTDTVSVAFYGGDRAPILSGLGALFGLPFSSVAVCLGSDGLKVDRRTGDMVSIGAAELSRSKKYAFVHTGVQVTDEMRREFSAIRGKSAVVWGPIRGKCLSNFRGLLGMIGNEWRPSGFRLIPSLYYSQCLRARNG